MRVQALAFWVALGLISSALAADRAPGGLLALSVGEEVVLADPASGWSQSFAAGTVGWLYPAPGGVLFAPDVVHGRTLVIDLKARTVRERLEGVTVPTFGEQPDRYVVVTKGQVMVFSYPERALVTEVAAEVIHPWQLALAPDQTSVLVLDREPGGGGSSLVAVDLTARQVIYRRRLGDGDVVRMALSPTMALLAVADAVAGKVCLIDPAQGEELGCWPVPGSPRDLLFSGDPEQLAIAVATPAGAGTLLLWRLKARSSGYEVKSRELGLSGAPVRLATDPGRSWLAVGLASGKVELVDIKRRATASTIALPGEPRDMVWCDPDRPGPLLPEWSDRRPPQLELGQDASSGTRR